MALVAISIAAHVSYATIVERIVAVVGERAILLSELRKRAKPLLMQIYKSPTTPTTRAAQETQLYREILDRMIDDMLSEQAATRANLAVSTAEVDRAIRAVAEGQKLSPADLLKAAEREGFTPPIPDYDAVKPLMRDEAMRDIVDRQWKTWLQEQRRNVYIDVRL